MVPSPPSSVYTNVALLPWLLLLLLLLCPRCGGLVLPPPQTTYFSISVSINLSKSVSLPTCRLPPAIYNLPLPMGWPPPPPFPPMQCYDCRIALVEFDFFLQGC